MPAFFPELMLNPMNPFILPEIILMLKKMIQLKRKMNHITYDIHHCIQQVLWKHKNKQTSTCLARASMLKNKKCLAQSSLINSYLIYEILTTLTFYIFTLLGLLLWLFFGAFLCTFFSFSNSQSTFTFNMTLAQQEPLHQMFGVP